MSSAPAPYNSKTTYKPGDQYTYGGQTFTVPYPMGQPAPGMSLVTLNQVMAMSNDQLTQAQTNGQITQDIWNQAVSQYAPGTGKVTPSTLITIPMAFWSTLDTQKRIAIQDVLTANTMLANHETEAQVNAAIASAPQMQIGAVQGGKIVSGTIVGSGSTMKIVPTSSVTPPPTPAPATPSLQAQSTTLPVPTVSSPTNLTTTTAAASVAGGVAAALLARVALRAALIPSLGIGAAVALGALAYLHYTKPASTGAAT